MCTYPISIFIVMKPICFTKEDLFLHLYHYELPFFDCVDVAYNNNNSANILWNWKWRELESRY